MTDRVLLTFSCIGIISLAGIASSFLASKYTTKITSAAAAPTIDTPGDWAFHCHMTHYVMNQMGHQFLNMGC